MGTILGSLHYIAMEKGIISGIGKPTRIFAASDPKD
jgi:hypothetical protein